MKRRRFILLLTILGWSGLDAQPVWHGYVMQHTAFRVEKPQDALLLRTRLRLNSEYSGENIYGYASLDFLNDAAKSDQTTLNLKALYLDIYSNYLDWRIGKQQVVWGKADGYFINDIVNPLDLSYFLLQDFDDIRMATTLVKNRLHFGNQSLEVVFIPEFRPTRLNFSGDWGFARPDSVVFNQQLINPIIPGSYLKIPLSYADETIPRFSLRKAEWGLKLNTFVLGTDLSFIYLKIREDRPVYYKTMNFGQGGLPISINLRPTHPWLQFYGINFSRPTGMFVWRGEGGYFPHRFFDIENPTYLPAGGIVKKPFWQGMLGVDYQLTTNLDIGVQGIHEEIVDYESGIHEARRNNIGTLMLKGHFVNETVLPLLLTLYNFEDDSYLMRLMVDWNYADNFTISAGLDILGGKSSSLFGQFDRNDNLYFKIVYSF